MASEHPYAHLSPELRRLSGDVLLLWGDAAERGRALAAVLAAWDSAKGTALRSAIGRIDSAVRAGLEALALPRDAASTIRIVSEGRTWIGRVAADRVFAAGRIYDRPDAAALSHLWETVFR